MSEFEREDRDILSTYHVDGHPPTAQLPACLPSPSLMVVGAMGCGGDGGSLLERKEGRGAVNCTGGGREQRKTPAGMTVPAGG